MFIGGVGPSFSILLCPTGECIIGDKETRDDLWSLLSTVSISFGGVSNVRLTVL